MTRPRVEEPDLGPLRRELQKAGGEVRRLRDFLEVHGTDRVALLSLLRRPVPVRLLEVVATTPPWSSDPFLLGAVVMNPRTPRALALRLVDALFWRDLAEVAALVALPAAVRMRAENQLLEQIPDLRLGDKITLARRAVGKVALLLLADTDVRVVAPCLESPRLREADLLVAIRAETPSRILLETVGASSRWMERYAVRLELVRQPRTPLGVALAQISSLVPGDLREVAGNTRLAPLVQMAAERLLLSKPR
jgi:hypothetical protein